MKKIGIIVILFAVAILLVILFKPDRMNKIVDDLAKEIEEEMPYHINKWGSSYGGLSMSSWKNNIKGFKNSLNTRYNRVVNNIRNYFNLSNNDYNKYFGDLK